MKKILIIIGYPGIGDTIFTIPAIRSVKRAFPECKITVMARPRTKADEIFKHDPDVSDVIIFDKDNKHKGITGTFKIISSLKKEKYDVVFILHNSFRYAFISAFSGINERVGFDTENRGFLLTDKMKEPFIPKSETYIEYFNSVIWGYGIKKETIVPQIFFSDIEIKNIKKKFPYSEKEWIALAPGCSEPTRRWGAERFSEVASYFNRKYHVFGVGGGADSHLVADIEEKCGRNVLIDATNLPILESAALLSRVKLLIANDTGPLHLAAAVGTKVLGLYGATEPYTYSPLLHNITHIVHCSPCKNFNCSNNICMDLIEVSEVIKKSEELL